MYVCTLRILYYYYYVLLSFGLQILEEDVHSYEKTVEELGQEATKLVSGGHFDCTNITARQVRLLNTI